MSNECEAMIAELVRTQAAMERLTTALENASKSYSRWDEAARRVQSESPLMAVLENMTYLLDGIHGVLIARSA